jgi:hypothetical protein
MAGRPFAGGNSYQPPVVSQFEILMIETMERCLARWP